MIEHFDDVVMAAQGAVIDEARSIEDVEAWFGGIVACEDANGCRGGCPVGSLAAELADADELARTAVGECFARWRRRIAAAYGHMVHDGALVAEADVDALAAATLAAVEGGLLLQVGADNRVDARRTRCSPRPRPVLVGRGAWRRRMMTRTGATSQRRVA